MERKEVEIDLGRIKTEFDGFRRIIEVCCELNAGSSDNFTIRMQNWVDANMCAPLGAILHKAQSVGCQINISDISGKQKTIMQKNHFLSHFGEDSVPDSFGTTIEYRRFKPSTEGCLEFAKYVVTHFRPGRKGLPAMTQALLKNFRSSLFEIFHNAIEHSYTNDEIFACGQFFPKSHRLIFTIADLGIGIDGNIQRNLDISLPSQQAIKWALSGKTTRRDRSGGLGLQLIQDFVKLNKGNLMIVSGDAYGDFKDGIISTYPFQKRFPGTVATIDIDTTDKNSYCLSSEINLSEIL